MTQLQKTVLKCDVYTCRSKKYSKFILIANIKAKVSLQLMKQQATEEYERVKLYRVTQKDGNFWKTQQKFKKSKKKKLLTEIEPLQLAL